MTDAYLNFLFAEGIAERRCEETVGEKNEEEKLHKKKRAGALR
jgi:hypothetical protein